MTERTSRASRASTTHIPANNGKSNGSGLTKPDIVPVKRARKTAAANDIHDRKREQILDVAVNLFFRHGYAGTTIADIADKLGVTKPFVYYYFENKEELFETLTWEASNACLTSLHFPTSDKRTAIDKLREGLRRFAASNIENFKAGTFYYRETGALRPAFVRKVRVLGRRFHTDLYTLLEAGKRDGDLDFDNAKLTAFAVASIVGFMYVWYNPNGPIGTDAMAERMTDMMLKAAGARLPKQVKGRVKPYVEIKRAA